HRSRHCGHPDPGTGSEARPGRSASVEQPGSARSGNDLSEMPEEAGRRALRDGARGSGGPGAIPSRGADPGAAGGSAGANLALVPAQPGGGRAVGNGGVGGACGHGGDNGAVGARQRRKSPGGSGNKSRGGGSHATTESPGRRSEGEGTGGSQA